jgi:hypothetical protein
MAHLLSNHYSAHNCSCLQGVELHLANLHTTSSGDYIFCIQPLMSVLQLPDDVYISLGLGRGSKNGGVPITMMGTLMVCSADVHFWGA